MSAPVGVRLATPEDIRFVASTWFRAVLESGVALNAIPFAIVRDGLDSHIKKLLEKSETRVSFATAAPDEILGYIVIADKRGVWTKVDEVNKVITMDTVTVCHHLYVKSTYRRQGIARALLGDIKTYTHPATPGAGKKFTLALGLTYNPRLA